jgi:hypothetical protein
MSDALAAAPGLITIGGKEFLVGQASHGDLVQVRKALKSKMPGPLKMLEALMKEPAWAEFPADLKRELMKEAGQAQMKGESPLSDEMVLDLLSNDPALVAMLAWTLIHKMSKETKLAELKALVNDENAGTVLFELLEASGLASAEKNSDGPSGSPTAATGALP